MDADPEMGLDPGARRRGECVWRDRWWQWPKLGHRLQRRWIGAVVPGPFPGVQSNHWNLGESRGGRLCRGGVADSQREGQPAGRSVGDIAALRPEGSRSGLLVGADIDIAAVDQKNRDRDGRYVAIVDNYLTFIAHPAAALKDARWDDLLDPRLRGKLQYSTPGQAGDGTAMLVLLQHLMGDQGAVDYLSRLQHNNVGPSSSTGKLQPKVSNGELWVANGDLQMNLASIREDHSNFSIFIPAARDGKRSTISLPYVAAVTNGAPHAENARKLLTYLLSVPVQRTIPREALGMPVRADVQPEAGANTPAQVLEGVHIWHPDWDQVVSTLDASLIAYHQETGS